MYVLHKLYPPQSGLHSVLWVCRYVCAALCLTIYVWEWFHFLDYGERNYRLLSEIRQMMSAGRQVSVQQDGGPYDERIRTGVSKVCVLWELTLSSVVEWTCS